MNALTHSFAVQLVAKGVWCHIARTGFVEEQALAQESS